MSSVLRFLNKKNTALILFTILAIIGIFAFDDFGMSMDEEYQREHSVVTYRWLNRKLFNRGVFVDEATENIEKYGGKKYGVAMQLPLVFAEDVYNVIHGEPMSFRQIYLVRHTYQHFWFLVGLLCFYFLLYDLYGSPLLSAAGVLMIYVFGRVFADSFYNIKDMLFTSMTMINLFFGERVLRSGRKTKWCIFYAVSTAFLVSSRIVGAIFPLLLIVLMGLDDIRTRRKINLRPYLIIFASYLIWLAITPASWNNPFAYSFTYAKKFSNYTPKGNVLFDGVFYKCRELPADYYLRWIGISVPLVFLAFSIIGLIFFAKRLAVFRNLSEHEAADLTVHCQAFGMFAITILYQMIKHPTIYNGWRHVYYLYPLIILMAVKGVDGALRISKNQWQRAVVILILTVSIVYNAFLTIQNHPFGFNALNLIGQIVGHRYDRDYWEAGAYQVMAWIADNTEERVSVGDLDVVRHNFKADYMFLPLEKQELIYIPTDETDYIVFRHTTDGGEDVEIDGYTRIREFSAYNVLLYSVFQKNQQP